MDLRSVFVNSACLLAGAAMGAFFTGKFLTGSEKLPTYHLNNQARYHSREVTINRASGDGSASSIAAKSGGTEMPGAIESKDLSQARIADPEGLSGQANPDRNGRMVVVSVDLLKQMSQAARVRSLDQDLFAGSGELAASLQINEAEKERMESEWEALRERVRTLEKKTATIQEKPDGTLEIVLSGLGAEIDQLKEGFRSTMEGIVGSNRSEILFAATQIDAVVDELGHDRKMMVCAEETGDGGWRYHAVVEGANGKRTYVGENVPQSIRNLTGDLQMGHTSDETP